VVVYRRVSASYVGVGMRPVYDNPFTSTIAGLAGTASMVGAFTRSRGFFPDSVTRPRLTHNRCRRLLGTQVLALRVRRRNPTDRVLSKHPDRTIEQGLVTEQVQVKVAGRSWP
jgi:hypothetical protein